MSLKITNFTEPKIVTNDNLQHRSYVTFYFDNELQKEYHGKNVGLKINPNRASSLGEKSQLLKKLQFEIHKALEVVVTNLLKGSFINSRNLMRGKNSIGKYY